LRQLFTRSEQLAYDLPSQVDRCCSVPAVTLDWDGVRRERLVKNEQSFRDYNTRRAAFEEEVSGAADLVPFVCECGDRSCIEGVELTIEEYTSAHSAPNRFTVKPEHVYPEVEHVTATGDRFWVVEKDVIEATT
jgi:hypothetical protein